MTIAICTLVPSGIVLAADSRQLSRSKAGNLRVDSDSADKIFALGTHSAAIIHGQGFLYLNATESPRALGSILQSIARGSGRKSVRATAEGLHHRLLEDFERHREATGVERTSLAFHVAGYDPDREIGELYRCDLPGGVRLERTTNDAGLVWSGCRSTVSRLILGYDPELLELVAPRDEPPGLGEALRAHFCKLQLHIGFQTMPLQDAVDLSTLLVRTTIEIQRLSDGIVGALEGGPAACGGPVDVAVLTANEGLRWLQSKRLGVHTS